MLHVLGAALGEEPRDPLTDVRARRGVARADRSGRSRVHVASAAGLTPPPPLPARGAATLVNRTTGVGKVYRPGEKILQGLHSVIILP